MSYREQMAKLRLREARDKRVVRLRKQGHSLRAIGAMLGITYERVRQICEARK